MCGFESWTLDPTSERKIEALETPNVLPIPRSRNERRKIRDLTLDYGRKDMKKKIHRMVTELVAERIKKMVC